MKQLKKENQNSIKKLEFSILRLNQCRLNDCEKKRKEKIKQKLSIESN